MTTTERQPDILPEYNGYRNYPTWNVASWLDNDPHTNKYLHDLANEGSMSVTIKAERLKGLIESAYIPHIASMKSDLIGWVLAYVDWREIIKSHQE